VGWELAELDALVLPLGILIACLVALRLGMLVIASVRRFIHQRSHQQFAIELMRQRIDAAKRQRESNALAWNGYRKFVVDKRVDETADVCSLVLSPHDRKPLPTFQPGQYLTFRLAIPGREKPIIRCYSVSDRHRAASYRVSIKRVMSPADAPAAPPGLVSNYFHEQLGVGDILDVQAPRGNFFLDSEKQRPAVLVAGGVGVTPLLSMAQSVAEEGAGREILIFYGVRNGASHAFKTELEEVAQRHANIRLVVCYSQPAAEDEAGEGRDYHHAGRVTLELVKSYLQSTNYEFYICGPPPMMESLVGPLAKWGVAKSDIHTEAFGPATVGKSRGQTASDRVKPPPATERRQVKFSKAGKTCQWDGQAENLLDLASREGIAIESGCRAGNCGTCVVAIKAGKVSYLSKHGVELEEGTCLTCIAIPDGDVELDA
jgi:hypothetical protein